MHCQKRGQVLGAFCIKSFTEALRPHWGLECFSAQWLMTMENLWWLTKREHCGQSSSTWTRYEMMGKRLCFSNHGTMSGMLQRWRIAWEYKRTLKHAKKTDCRMISHIVKIWAIDQHFSGGGFLQWGGYIYIAYGRSASTSWMTSPERATSSQKSWRMCLVAWASRMSLVAWASISGGLEGLAS